MAKVFDAYHEWLGIAPKDQPPNHYRLLGIDLGESSPDVISNAAGFARHGETCARFKAVRAHGIAEAAQRDRPHSAKLSCLIPEEARL